MQRPALRALLFGTTLFLAFSVLAMLSMRPISAVGSDTTITICTEANFDAALQAAQANGGGGTITFDCPAPTLLGLSSQKEITAAVTIQSSGALTLTGNASIRHFNVNGASAALTLTNLSLVNGASSGGGAVLVNNGGFTATDVTFRDNNSTLNGGAINATNARIHLVRTTFTRNIGKSSGAMMAVQSSVIIQESHFIENSATTDDGGAIQLISTDGFRIESSEFISNTSGNQGGGLVILSATSGTMENLHFEGNRAPVGAGLFLFGGQAQGSGVVFFNNHANASGGGISSTQFDLALTTSALLSNTASGGGGISVNSGSVVLTETTLIANSAEQLGGALWVHFGSLRLVDGGISGSYAQYGGAARVEAGGELQIERSTVSGNSADIGGAFFVGDDGHIVLTNTTVSGNTAFNKQGHALAIDTSVATSSFKATHTTFADNGAALSNDSWALWTTGTPQVDLVSSVLANGLSANCLVTGAPVFASVVATDNSCGATGVTVVADAKLGPLANNGGHTPTHLPAPDSPVVDIAPCLATVPTDQRGVTRGAPPALCESGAVERAAGEEEPSALNFAPAQLLAGTQAVGANLGVLSTVDIDPADRFTYTVLSSSAPLGVTAGANVLTGTLQVASAPLPRGVYTLTAQSIDRAGNAITGTFQITVNNAAPSAPLLATLPLSGTQPTETVVGTLSATDADGDALTFSASGSQFVVNGTELRVGNTPLHKGTHAVAINVMDGHGGTNQATFQVVVENAPPSALHFSPTAPFFHNEAPKGTVVATLSTTDADASDATTFAVVAQTGPNGAEVTGTALFAVANGNQLVVAAENGLIVGDYSATVRATDGSGASIEGTVQVTVALRTYYFLVPVESDPQQ